MQNYFEYCVIGLKVTAILSRGLANGCIQQGVAQIARPYCTVVSLSK